MPRYGFIHDKLDIKFLILYLMSRVASPIGFSTLTELVLCDDGVDYFDFAESAAELVQTGHLTLENDQYAITEKGMRNGGYCESSLPYSVRLKCDKNLTRINAVLRRNAQVRTEIDPREDGTHTLRLILDDNTGNLLTLSLMTGSHQQAEQLAKKFRDRPEQVYNGILGVLLSEEETPAPPAKQPPEPSADAAAQ